MTPESAPFGEKELPRWVLIPAGVVLGLLTLFCVFALVVVLLSARTPTPILGFVIFGLLLLPCCWALAKCFRLVTGRRAKGGLLSPLTLRIAGYCLLVFPVTGLFTGYYRTMGPLAILQALFYLFGFFGLRALAQKRETRENQAERDQR